MLASAGYDVLLSQVRPSKPSLGNARWGALAKSSLNSKRVEMVRNDNNTPTEDPRTKYCRTMHKIGRIAHPMPSLMPELPHHLHLPCHRLHPSFLFVQSSSRTPHTLLQVCLRLLPRKPPSDYGSATGRTTEGRTDGGRTDSSPPSTNPATQFSCRIPLDTHGCVNGAHVKHVKAQQGVYNRRPVWSSVDTTGYNARQHAYH